MTLPRCRLLVLLVLLVTAAATTAEVDTGDEYQDLTVVLRPEQDVDWKHIEKWMQQNGIVTEAPVTASPPQHGGPSSSTPDSTTTLTEPESSEPRGFLRQDTVSPLRPGPALLPGAAPVRPSSRSSHLSPIRPIPAHIQPGPAYVPSLEQPDPTVPAPMPLRAAPPPATADYLDMPEPKFLPEPEDAPPRSAASTDGPLLSHHLTDGGGFTEERPGDLLFRLEPIVDEVPPANPPKNATSTSGGVQPAIETADFWSGYTDPPRTPEPYGPTRQPKLASNQHLAEYGDQTNQLQDTYRQRGDVTTSSSPVRDRPPQPATSRRVSYPSLYGDESPQEDNFVSDRLPSPPSQPSAGVVSQGQGQRSSLPSGGSITPGAGQGGSPDVLVTLLQRLEDRLVASEEVQRQQANELRVIQHRQRKSEVVQSEQKEDIRSQFNNLEHKVDNLQADLSRVTTLLEAVLGDVQTVARHQREQRSRHGSSSHSDRAHRVVTDSLTTSVGEMGQSIGQLVVTTELLKSGQRTLTSNVRLIANQTRELAEKADEFATKVTVAGSLSEIRNYLDRHQGMTPVLATTDREPLPADCSEVQLADPSRQSGIYQVRPRGAVQPIFVYCDLDTDGGGWAVIQRRENGEEDFFQDWLAYKYGFGNLGSEFWLGNENIHLLTNHRLNELRVDLSDFPRERPGYDAYMGSNATAHYGTFAVGSETEGYSLKILEDYSGDAGDSLKYHAGMKFSTKDMDNDLWKEDSCAVAHKGGWWYKGCDSSNLNGLYLSGAVPAEHEYQVVYWYDWRGPLYSLYRTRMMVRPTDHKRSVTRHRGEDDEGGKMAAQRRSTPQTVRRGRRRRPRRRKGRRHRRDHLSTSGSD